MRQLVRALDGWMISGVLGWSIWELWSWWGLFWYCIGLTVVEMIYRAVISKES